MAIWQQAYIFIQNIPQTWLFELMSLLPLPKKYLDHEQTNLNHDLTHNVRYKKQQNKHVQACLSLQT